MASFGENLRRERELRGITLPELANATKIAQRYLEALERNRFEQLPGGIFNRGFVRAVARYLKLDESFWVSEFVRAAHEEPDVVARYALVPPGPPASARVSLWSFLLLVAVFAGAAYLVHDARLRRAAEAASAPATREVLAVTTSSTPATPGPTAAKALEPVRETRAAPSPAPASASVAAPQPGELRLQVDVLEEAWVSVAVDGRTRYEGVLKSGESRTFRGGQQIELTTRNASAVVLTLNGETLPPLGNPGERKNVVLTAKDLKPAP